MTRYGDVRRLKWRGRTSARWYVRVHRPDGKSTWKCTGYEDRDCAVAIVKRWQLTAISADIGRPTPPETTLAIERWRTATVLGRSASYARIVSRFVGQLMHAIRDVPVDRIGEEHVVAYVERRLADGLAPRTMNLEITLWRMFAGWLLEQGWIARNPVGRRMRILVPRTTPRILTNDEQASLLAAAADLHERAYGYVLCLLVTGFRSGLAMRVRWEHADLERGMWHIPGALCKSGCDYVQPITPCLLAWLRDHAKPEGRIFGPHGKRWWLVIRERARLPGLLQHDLRRNFVTRCRRGHVPMETTMALSDHHDVRTMLRVYRAVDVEDTREALHRAFGAEVVHSP